MFETYLNIKYYANPSSGSPVAPCGWADMTKLIVAFHNYANAPKYSAFCTDGVSCVCYDPHNQQTLFPHTALTGWSI